MARPTKYNAKLLKKAQEYLNGGYTAQEEVCPTVAGLATYININKSTIYDWAKHEDKAEFSNTLDGIIEKQERLLVSKGLSGDFNPTIAKLMLANHGYSDKQVVDNKYPDGPPQTNINVDLTPAEAYRKLLDARDG